MHIVHTEASLGWGGQEIRILNEAKAIVERGHRVTLITPSESNIYREGQARGLETIALPIGRKKVSGIFAIRDWLKKNKVDIVNTHSSTDSWLTTLACKFLDNPPKIVRTRHISAPVPRNMATNWLYTKATEHIVTTGERLRNELIDRNGYDPKNITSVPTGIDTSIFSPGEKIFARENLNIPVNKKVIGIVATLRSWKGHAYLLDAFAAFEDKSTLLVMVGEGPYRNVLEEQIQRLGLRDRVIMPGNQSNVVQWLRTFDVFALPSYANEGVPQAILQAMSCGIPVVSTPIGSIAEAVRDGETGMIVPARDSLALGNAINTLLNDADTRLTYGNAARQIALEKFGINIMADKMETIFHNAVGK